MEIIINFFFSSAFLIISQNFIFKLIVSFLGDGIIFVAPILWFLYLSAGLYILAVYLYQKDEVDFILYKNFSFKEIKNKGFFQKISLLNYLKLMVVILLNYYFKRPKFIKK